MNQAWQLGHQSGPARRFLLHVLDEATPTQLFVHPALKERLGGFPQVEFGIELAAKAFDIEERLLQQHQLRLDLDIETARGLEQAQQHTAKGNFLERTVED